MNFRPRLHRHSVPTAFLAGGLLAAPSAMGQSIATLEEWSLPAVPSLTLDSTKALQPEATSTTKTDPPAPADPSAPPADLTLKKHSAWGETGDLWMTLGAGYAYDFNSDSDINGSLAISGFIAKDLEFIVELSGWYFAQTGQDTGGISGSMIFRWHFWESDEKKTWTIYGDAGIGLLGSFNDVPSGGTCFNFLPRLGGGFTYQPEGWDSRLEVGLNWHHISNGRIEGDSNNPSRNSLRIYFGLIFPI